jgi:hypothetical protein
MTPQDSLAALTDARFRERRSEQPVKGRLDVGVTYEIPGPRLLASAFALPWLVERFDVYRDGAALSLRAKGSTGAPTSVDQLALAEELRATLAALPERSDAGRPYRDLRVFAAHALPGTVTNYLRDTVTAVRRLAPAWRPPQPPRPPRGPALTPAERKAAQRDRDRASEIASARWWLESLLDEADDDLAVGERITAAALYELASDTLGDLADDAEPLDANDPDGPIARVPGPRVFYAVADDLLGTRRRGAHGAQTYVVPPAFNIARVRYLLRHGRRAEALTLQRRHYADR